MGPPADRRVGAGDGARASVPHHRPHQPELSQLRKLRPDQPDAAIPLVLGLGETFIILMGSIDLSVEGILTLAAVILSMTVLNGLNDNNLGLLAVLLVLAVGGLVGFANGIVHVRLKVPSFMATLGS